MAICAFWWRDGVDEPSGSAHRLGDDDAAQRLVAGGHALGEGHEVGSDAERLSTEPGTGATEPADDLVEDQQRIVLIAQPTEAFEVPVLRRMDAACALHGLADDRRNPVAVLGEHLGGFLDVSTGNLHHVREKIAPALAVELDALRGRAADVGAVVAVGAANDDLLLGRSATLLDHPREFEGRVHRLGTRTSEENASVGVGRLGRNEISGFGGSGVRERIEDAIDLELLHLRGDGLDDLGAAVANLAVPKAGHTVEILFAGVVSEGRPLGTDDVDEIGFRLRWLGEGVHQGRHE